MRLFALRHESGYDGPSAVSALAPLRGLRHQPAVASFRPRPAELISAPPADATKIYSNGSTLVRRLLAKTALRAVAGLSTG